MFYAEHVKESDDSQNDLTVSVFPVFNGHVVSGPISKQQQQLHILHGFVEYTFRFWNMMLHSTLLQSSLTIVSNLVKTNNNSFDGQLACDVMLFIKNFEQDTI